MASVSLRRTQSSGNRQKWTYSAWIKRTGIGVLGSLIGSSSTNDDNGYGQIRFQADDTLQYTAWSADWFTTNRKFRDPNAWYHIVVRVDTTQGNVTDRIRLYINGVEETSFSASANPSSGQNLSLNVNNYYVYLGAECYSSGTSRFFDGVISHIHFLDGEDRTPDYFGETDSTTGEWKIKTNVTGVNYGTNGFFILKDGNSLTDQSGQSNNFTLHAGTLTKTEDNPSNVYTVWNANSTVSYKQSGNPIVFSNGATSLLENGGEYKNAISTLGAFTGKYYFETKMISPNNSLAESTYVGVVTATAQANVGDNYNHVGYTANSVGYNSYAGQVFTSDSGSNYGASLANGDILGVALDITNLKVYFSKNGVWQNSGVPTSGSTGTGAVSLPSTGDAWLFGGSPRNSSIQSNFGNGYFGTTAVSSAGTNASNNGIFEYDVPTGYTALSTKGLNL